MAEGLSSGFFTKHLEIKSQNSGLNLSGSFTVGGGFVGIMNMAWGKMIEGGGEVRNHKPFYMANFQVLKDAD